MSIQPLCERSDCSWLSSCSGTNHYIAFDKLMEFIAQERRPVFVVLHYNIRVGKPSTPTGEHYLHYFKARCGTSESVSCEERAWRTLSSNPVFGSYWLKNKRNEFNFAIFQAFSENQAAPTPCPVWLRFSLFPPFYLDCWTLNYGCMQCNNPEERRPQI